jgi:hypothetical protein
VAAIFVNGLGQNEQTLKRIFHRCSKTILVSDWLISKKSSPLKPLCQINRNLVGSIYGRSSIKIAHFVLIHKIFLEIDQSETRIAGGGHIC